MTTMEAHISPPLNSPIGVNNPRVAVDDHSAELVRLLDKTIPLKGRSHREIIAYGVHTPLWHSECYGLTADGEKIGFERKHNFLGWSGRNPIASLLFQYGDSQLELRLLNDRSATGPVAEVNLVQMGDQKSFNQSAYIGTSGALI